MATYKRMHSLNWPLMICKLIKVRIALPNKIKLHDCIAKSDLLKIIRDTISTLNFLIGANFNKTDVIFITAVDIEPGPRELSNNFITLTFSILHMRHNFKFLEYQTSEYTGRLCKVHRTSSRQQLMNIAMNIFLNSIMLHDTVVAMMGEIHTRQCHRNMHASLILCLWQIHHSAGT